MRNLKIFRLIIVLLPVLIGGAIFALRSSSKFTFSNDPKQFNSFSYSDLLQGGKTQIERFPTVDQVMIYEYTLRSGAPFPYCGVGIGPKAPEQYFKLAPYDEIEIEILASRGKRISIQIGVFVEGLTNPETNSPLRFLMYDLDLKTGQSHYTLPLDVFVTPTWWYNENHITVEQLGKTDFNLVKSINFQNCQLIGLDKSDMVTVKTLVFRKDPWKHWPYFLAGCALYYICLFVIFNKKPKVTISPVINTKISFQEKLQLQNHSDKDLEKLITYLGSHYQDTELSIPMVQKETGVSESKISTLLKSEFGTTFKQYVTEIRLNEAKRLLKETDLQISEIAYAVGFGNVSHFNRVFKAEVNQSPSAFRSGTA